MGTVPSGSSVTNTFNDTAGERLHTLRTTVVGLTAEDLNPAIKTAVQKTLMRRGHLRSRRRGVPQDGAPGGSSTASPFNVFGVRLGCPDVGRVPD
jgi:hypothetical protein